MAELHWFPSYVSEWLGSPAVSMMLPEQEGAYWRLLNLAWGKGEHAPFLPTDDAQLAQMSRLGARWKKLGPLVRAQFVEREGQLVHERLTAIWWEQQAKHTEAVRKATAGGKAKAEKERARRAAADAQGVLEAVLGADSEHRSKRAELESDLEGAVKRGPKGPSVLLAPAPGGARSPEGARATGADLTAAGQSGDDAYRAGLSEFVRTWAIEHYDEYRSHVAAERVSAGIPSDKVLSEMGEQVLAEAVLERVRVALKLPTRDEWFALRSKAETKAVGSVTT